MGRTGTPPAGAADGVRVEDLAFGPTMLPHDAADALAALTARAADVPTVLILMVDGDQLRLAGAVGLPVPWDPSRRIPASITLAGTVLATGQALIIEDIATDDRVPRDSPVRRLPFLSYAGFPIRDTGATAVGVCAAVDTRVRSWQPSDLASVQEGARACAVFVEQRRLAEAADRSRRFLDALVDSLHVGVAAVDAGGDLVVMNTALREMSGDLPAADDPQAWAGQRELTDAAGRPLTLDSMPLLRALRGEHLHDLEVVLARPGHCHRTFLAEAQPITGADGRLLGAVTAAQEVTDQRRVERFHDCELTVARELARATTLAEAAEPVLRAIAATLDWPHAELWLPDQQAQVLRPVAVFDTGTHPPIAVPEGLPPGRGLAGGAWQTGEPVWIADLAAGGAGPPDGTAGGTRTAVALPVPGGDGTAAVLTLFADFVEEPRDQLVTLLSGPVAQIGQFLTHRRAQELELALAHTKDEYVALVGHEMRTPLTSIAAYTDILTGFDAGDFAAEGHDVVEVVRRNTGRLCAIVDELLDLSALDSGHAGLDERTFDLATLVNDAVAGAAYAAGPGGPRLRCAAPERCAVRADERRIRQVVDALLSNAVLHTGPGGAVDVTLTASPGAVELTVADTGIGIPRDEQHGVFTRFYRSSHTRERRIPGAGLGLAISRVIVERHRGTIRLLPDHRPGTCVQVRLPTGGD